MALAQMNWGRLRYALDDPRMSELRRSMAKVYALAETHSGFIWRIPDIVAAAELADLGYDSKLSATVSVWKDVASLRDYTFNSLHGVYLERASEWFEPVAGRQLVMWNVDATARPSFREAFKMLDMRNQEPASQVAFGWPD